MARRTFCNWTPLRESGPSLRQSQKGPAGNRIYRGVTIIKSGLGNRKDKHYYSPEAIRHGVKAGMFEGLKAFADHPDAIADQVQPERTIRDFVGLYENARIKEDGGGRVRAVADFRVLRAHKWLANVIDELIEINHADKIGLSINGSGRTTPKKVRLAETGNEEIEVNQVDEFLALKSADVVTEAGAGGGFQQVLESARDEEIATMNKDQLVAKLREAATKPKSKETDDEVVKLSAQLAALEEDDADTDDDGQPAKRKAKAGREEKAAGKSKRKVAAKRGRVEEAEDDEDEAEDDEEADYDAELDEAVEAAAEGDDEADDDDTGDDEDDDVEESDEDEDDEDVEEAEDEEADVDDTRGRKMVRAAGKLKQHAATSRTTREGKKAVPGKKGSGITGIPTKNTGTALKRGKQSRQAGRVVTTRTKEGARPSLEQENRILRKQLTRAMSVVKTAESANRAKKLLKESDIPVELRPAMVGRLMRCGSEREMRSEIVFQERLLESASRRAADDVLDNFDEIEGMPSSLRESFDGRDDHDFGELLAGLPIRKEKS